LNFRFALRDVTDLDYEFTALMAAGFAFVNLDAASLIKGLPGPGGVAPAAEACRHMSEVGLAVIVGGLDDEATRATILQCGAPLGQGPFFGPPLTVAGKGFPGTGTAAA
jgi:EAL domain-containing protein (putative c-di-GMP-specific phosphodiesterase class I)